MMAGNWKMHHTHLEAIQVVQTDLGTAPQGQTSTPASPDSSTP